MPNSTSLSNGGDRREDGGQWRRRYRSLSVREGKGLTGGAQSIDTGRAGVRARERGRSHARSGCQR
jgi:hypothetical protein